MEIANKLELHYSFNDDSHSMDAQLRNDCEAELLILFYEIADIFGIEVSIESEAFQEGGLVEILKIIGEHTDKITLLISILSLVSTRYLPKDKELIELQKKNLRLDNQKKAQEILKNQIELKSDFPEYDIDSLLKVIDSDYKVSWHRSNYYKKIRHYPKVTKISTRSLGSKNKPVNEKYNREVERKNFNKFIISSNSLSPMEDSEAIIIIISPVIQKGDFSWKGYYDNEVISFKVTDKEFNNAVQRKEYKFTNGMAINCSIERTRIINDNGEIKYKKNTVREVHSVEKDGKYELTQQELINTKINKQIENQTELDFYKQIKV